MSVNKTNAMWAYLSQYPELETYLKCNTSDNNIGEVAFNTSPSEAWEKKYLRDKGVKRYDFHVVMIRPHDTGTSILNIDEIFNVERFMEWITEQNSLKNFPNFGEDTKVLSIEPLQNMPQLATVDPDGAGAKYQFSVRVRYEIN